MKTLSLARYDVCLPDYWGGWAGPFLCLPISPDMTARDIADAVNEEYRMNGFYDDSKDDYTEDLESIMASFFVCSLDMKNPFILEPDTEEEDDHVYDSVYLHLGFTLSDDE